MCSLLAATKEGGQLYFEQLDLGSFVLEAH